MVPAEEAVERVAGGEDLGTRVDGHEDQQRPGGDEAEPVAGVAEA